MNEIIILGSALKIKEFVDEHAPGDRRHCVIVKGEMRSPSDGYHTFDELYEQRNALFIALCSAYTHCCVEDTKDVWRSKKHSDGTDAYEGWFVLGIGKDEGRIMTYHIPLSEWENTNFAETVECAYFDGHTSEDVLKRLKSL